MGRLGGSRSRKTPLYILFTTQQIPSRRRPKAIDLGTGVLSVNACGVKWCREAAINGRKSTQQNAVVSCGDRRVVYRCFSRYYSRRRLAVLLNSLRHEVVHVVAALQERSSGAIWRNGGRVEAY